jgi:hypothetical protein
MGSLLSGKPSQVSQVDSECNRFTLISSPLSCLLPLYSSVFARRFTTACANDTSAFPLASDSARATVSLKFKSDGAFVSSARRISNDSGPHVQQDRFCYTLSADFVWFEEAISAERLDARRVHEKEISLNTGCSFA